MSVGKAELERIKRLSEYKARTKPTYDGDDGRKDVQEKLRSLNVTVLKLTQVGGSRRLRRSREWWLRNSANWPRKFAIRGAPGGESCWGPQKIGSCDCLSKTQDAANS